MAERQTISWTITGVIPENTLGQIFGASGSGKTFVHLDMGLHVATGRDWHGHKVRQGAVLLIAGEGFYGLSKRLHAWAAHYEQDMAGVPFLMSRSAVTVSDRKALDHLRGEIAAVQDRLAVPLRWVVLDTLNRNFGPGDENSTQDMSRFIDGMAWLRDTLQVGVCPIHHTGHLEQGRSRGNSSLYGALDYEIRVERNRESRLITLACTKMKDSEEFPTKYFESVPVGTPITDDEGIIQTSIVLSETTESNADKSIDKGLGTVQRKMLGVLKDLYAEFSARLVEGGRPDDMARVYISDWKDRCYKTIPEVADRGAFFRRKKTLEERGLVRLEAPFVFLGEEEERGHFA